MGRNKDFGTNLRIAINLTAVHSQNKVVYIENELGKTLGADNQEKPYEYIRWLAKGNLPDKPRKMSRETLLAKCCERLLQLSDFQLPLENIQAILESAESLHVQDWLMQRLPKKREPVAANQSFDIPSVSPHFLAAELPIEHLSKCLLSYRILYITGLGGIGKTELALHLAHQNRSHFDHVLCYVHDNRKSSISSPEDLVDCFLMMLGQSKHPNWDAAQKLQALRNLLSAQRYLILVDNLETEPISSLVSGLVSALANLACFIVTSRVSLNPLQGYVYPLSSLSSSTARELILLEVSRLGKLSWDSAWMDAVLQLANGHPKTLIFLSHYLLMQPKSLEKFMQSVSPSKPAPDSFNNVLTELFQEIYGKVWQTLEADAQALMRLMLLVSDAGVQVDSLLIMSQLSAERFNHCSQQLIAYCFLESHYLGTKAYYKIHPLTKYYLQVFVFPDAASSNDMLYRQFVWANEFIDESDSNLDSLQQLIPQLLSLITEALLRQEEIDNRTSSLLFELVQKLHPILCFSDDWSSWEHILLLLCESTRWPALNLAAIHYQLAELWYWLGRWENSFELVKQRLLSPEVPALWKTRGAEILADIHRLRWEKHAGIEMLRQILAELENAQAAQYFLRVLLGELLRNSDDDELWAKTLNEAIGYYQTLPPDELAQVYDLYVNILLKRAAFLLNKGEFQSSEQDYLLARSLAERNKNIFRMMIVDGKLGVYYWSSGRLQDAQDILNRVIENGRALKTYWQLTFDIGNLALVYLTMGELALAERHFEEQYQLALRLSIPSEMSRAKANQAFIYLSRAQERPSDLPKALIDLDYDRFYTAKFGATREHTLSLINLAYIYSCLGKQGQANRMLEQAEAEARLSQSPILLGLVYRALAFAKDSADEKLLYLEMALALFTNERPLDRAACYFSLCQLTEDAELRQQYWQQACACLEQMQGIAWLESRTAANPPQLPLIF